MKKKSQIGQIFIYIISTIIVVLILYYGYAAVKNIGKKQEQLALVKFQRNIGDTIVYTSSDYGTVRVESFSVPVKFTEVCFVDPSLIARGDASPIDSLKYPIIANSVADKVNNNVFPLPDGVPFYIDKLWVSDNGGFLCFPVKQGTIAVRIEGFGDKAKISLP
ncbi:MAG: hypothetical protein QXG86_00380 [Candidatus Woesearchaeota archaeon]